MSGRSRMLGVAVVACGALVALLPALPWYAATLRSGTASLSGYGAGGASWILPVIGAALAGMAGILLMVSSRRTGGAEHGDP